MRWFTVLALSAAVSAPFTGAIAQRVDPLFVRGRVALTFDDLPVHGALPPGLSRVDVARRIVETLDSYHTPPVYGFINGKAVDEDPEGREVLHVWRAAGNPLANHTFSHMDLHAASIDAFEEDIVANEPALRAFMTDGDWRWFRFPFLREGDTPEKYRAVRAFLKGRGYRVAQVTLSFHDYAYNDPYARCLARGDKEALAWLEKQYIEQAAASLGEGQATARTIFGRDIPHVMLLHVGGFQTVMFPRLLDLLSRRGFVLTTLEEAQADGSYESVPSRAANWSGTLLDQMRVDPAPAVSPDDLFARLSSLCTG
jgi:peptidoglycan/xylan/chitin deacetylase (PgdA/CDA1 family)